MTWTVSDAITQAREIIQDSRTPYRNSDEQLLSYFNHGVTEIRRLRPDLFLGDEEEAQLEGAELHADSSAEELPVEQQYFSPLVFFVASMVAVSDDEFANNGRAAGLMQMFKVQLVGSGATN